MNEMVQAEDRLVEVFKQKAKELGMNQKELAKQSGITEASLSRYLNKKRKLMINQYLNICSALELDYSEVLNEALGRPKNGK